MRMHTSEVAVKRLFLHIARGRLAVEVVGEESGESRRESKSL